MRTCARCGRLFPEVVGATAQACPHCGFEEETSTSARMLPPADPLGAAALAIQFLRRDYGRLLLLALPFFALDLAAGFALQRYVGARGLDAAILTTGQQMQYLGVAVPLALLSGALQLAYWAVAAALLEDGRLGGARLRSLARRWGALLALGALLTLLYVAGVLMLLVPFLVFAHWFLYAPAAFAEGEGLGASIERSRRFARERRAHGFTALALLVWLAGIVAVLVVDVQAGARLGVFAPVAPALATWLLVPVVAAFPAAFWRLGAAGANDAAPTSAPSAPRASTACPRCGALIPYTPTGSPVDVTCPTCGTAGRVL